MKKVPHVFQYGVRESNGQPVGSTEQLPQPAGTSDLVPPQRSATESEGLSDPRGSGQLMPARQARLAKRSPAELSSAALGQIKFI